MFFLQFNERNYNMQYPMQYSMNYQYPYHGYPSGYYEQYGAPYAYGQRAQPQLYDRPVVPRYQRPVYARYDSSVHQCCQSLSRSAMVERDLQAACPFVRHMMVMRQN